MEISALGLWQSVAVSGLWSQMYVTEKKVKVTCTTGQLSEADLKILYKPNQEAQDEAFGALLYRLLFNIFTRGTYNMAHNPGGMFVSKLCNCFTYNAESG